MQIHKKSKAQIKRIKGRQQVNQFEGTKLDRAMKFQNHRMKESLHHLFQLKLK